MPNIKPTYLILVALLLPSVVVADLSISGLNEDLERNVRVFATIATEPCDAEAWLVRRRFRALESQVRKAIEPFGYYQPEITSKLVLDAKCWEAEVSVDPGAPVVLREVDIRIDGPASSDPAFQELLTPVSLTPGNALQHANYETLKKTLQIRAANRGYLEAQFSASRMDVWPELGVADVTLHFTSGPRYRLGKIRQNQAFIDPEIVLAYLDLEVGAYYDADDLARAYRDLSDSAYFGQIEILPDIANAADEHVPIQILLQPGTHVEYNVGVGASTDLGMRFRAGFRNNRINQRGHRLIADLGVSTVLQGLTTEYRIPLSDPRREWFSVTGAYTNEETDTFDNEVERLGVRWTKVMSDTWLRTLSLDANREAFIVGDDIETSRSIAPAITFDQKRSDRDLFPRSGRRLGVELGGTDKSLGSTMSYIQGTAWMRWIHSFGDHTRLLARLNAGFTKSDDFSELPPSVRFFAGGDESIRGFDYESLGPTDADGNVVGGDNLLVASIEYERHLKGNFYGAIFADAGNAFNNTDFKAEVGAGIGIKWRSPLGPIRLYLGYPVSQSDQSLRVHLRLGADL
jgi:translocation and assembly module TamA